MRKSVMPVMTIALLLVLIVTSAVPAFAQDIPAPFCGDLSEEDCTILADSQDASLAVESFSNYLDVNILIAGVPGMPADELAFNYNQDGTYSLDPALAKQIMEMQMQDPEALMEDMDAMIEVLLDLYANLALDTAVSFTMPQEIADLISEQAGVTIPTTVSAQAIMADGFGYGNIDELAAEIEELNAISGWYGIDVVSLMEMGFAQSQAQADQSGNMAASMTGYGMTNFLNSEEGRAMIEEYVEVERGDDETVDGADVAVFNSTFDFGGFIGSPVFAELLTSQLDTINQLAETDLSEEQLNEMLTLLPMFGPMLFTGLDFEVTRRIDLESYQVVESELLFDWDLSSLVAVAKMADASLELPEGMAPVITIEVVNNAADFDAIEEITAPEGASIVPLESLQ